MKNIKIHKIRTIITAAAITFMIGLASSVVQAKGVDRACREDAERLCPGKTWKKGLTKCFKKHAAEVSPSCKKKHKKVFR